MRLYNDDCLRAMALIPDASIDLILCDLPYGTTQNKWDSIISLSQLWAHYKRISQGAIVLTAAQPFTSALVMSNVDDFRYQWVWLKNLTTGFLNSKKQPLRAHEDVLVFWSGKQTLYNPQMILRTEKEMKRISHGGKEYQQTSNYGDYTPVNKGRIDRGEFKYPNTKLSIPAIPRGEKQKSQHPTQKPVALMEYLIKTYTHEGMTVLDNCMGSGTTGVACVNTNRKFIGIERDPEYFKIASERIFQAAIVKAEELCKPLS